MVLEVGYRFANEEAEGGLSGAVVFLDKASPSLFLGGSIGIEHFTNKVKSLSKGSVTLFPVMVRFLLQDPGGFSFRGGLGYVFANHSLDAEVTKALASLGLKGEEIVKDAIGAEVSLGYSAGFGSKESGGVFLGYQFHETKVEAILTSLSSGASLTVEGDVVLSTPYIRAFLSF